MNKHLGRLRLLFVVLAVSWGMSQGFAQTKPTPQLTPAAQSKAPAQTQAATPTAPDKVWVKDPNSVMPMRKMTNAERRAAAQRNQDRRAKAEAQKKQNKTNPQGGVQQ